MKNVLFIITLLMISVACTQREDVSAWVCDCNESDSLRIERFNNPDFDLESTVTKFCADTVVAVQNTWPNNVTRLDDSYESCFNIYDKDFNRINQ